MSRLDDVQKSLNYIENNLMNNLDAEVIAKNIYSSNHHFQKIFNIVTGLTVSDYIRCRRLSLAGKELNESKAKVIDVALKYGYETPESFSKAFQRFHGITPSAAKTSGSTLKYFCPLSIQIIINGGFTMARKLIPNVLRLYEVKSENYTFPSCMHSAMAALNEDEAFDFSFFAGITGDLFTQVWNTHKWSYNDAYSSVYRDGVENPIKAAFDACGYEYEFVIEEEIKKNKAMYIKKIMDSIDKGFPVITYGIVGPPICSIICGYDNNGEILIGRSQFIDEPQADNTIKLQVCEDYFQKENGLDNSEALIFFIKKKDTPLISESIQKSILNIPALASLPPVQGKRPSVFGKQAFDAWADMLLWDEDFINESMLASPLDTHGSCAVMLGTNIHYMRGYLDKAIHLCPDIVWQITELQNAYDKVKEEFDALIDFQGGYQFNKRKELLSKSFRIELAQRIREIGCLYMKTTSVIRQRD